MAIRLTWSNTYNGNVSGFKIYRSTVKATVFDPANLKAELATEILNYEDTTAVPDIVYYYGVESLTDLGPMKSKPIIAIQYMYTAGPGALKPQRGSYESGILDMTTGTHMADLWGVANAVQLNALSSTGAFNRATMNPVPGYREDLVLKMSVDGKASFIAADYRVLKTHATAAARQAFDEAVLAIMNDGVTFDYQGYTLKMDLMDADVAMNYWLRLSGGPNNLNGFMPRAVEKPIPSYANHYCLVRRGNKIFRMRAADPRPYLSTLTEATLAEAFTAGGNAYPMWQLTAV